MTTITSAGRWLALAIAWFLLVCVRGAMGETIQNDDPPFVLRVPVGFEQLPAAMNTTGPLVTLFTFVKRGPNGEQLDAAVSVQLLNGTIGSERPVLPPDAPAGSYLTFTKWKGYAVYVLVSNVSLSGVTLACRTVQIPLKRQAIQLVVGVPTNGGSNADAVLAEFLAGLDGPSNLPPPLSDAQEQALHLRRVVAAVIVPISGALVLWLIVALCIRSARNRKSDLLIVTKEERSRRALKTGGITAATVFVLNCIMCFLMFYLGYAAPMTPENAERRSYDLTMGTLKLTFFCGLIATGISYYVNGVRSRRRAVPPPTSSPSISHPGPQSSHANAADAMFNIVDDSD